MSERMRLPRLWRIASGLGRAIRDGWLVIGLALALVTCIELTYRAQGFARRGLRAPSVGSVPQGLYTRERWYADYVAEFSASSVVKWRPYVYWRRRPYSGVYVTVDSFGRRRTVQPEPLGPTHRDVWMFGGSTMWGTGQRDSMTIASSAARELSERGIHDVQVVNFGETGYVFTQEVLELLLQLRAGARPSVVVFYDGINDVFSAVQRGHAGVPQNEFRRERDFDMGHRLFDGPTNLGVPIALGRIAAVRLQFLDGLRFRGRAQASIPSDSLASDIVRTYVGTVEWVEALARYYGFTPVYVWQPSLHSQQKPLSSFERDLLRDTGADSLQQRLIGVYRSIEGRLTLAAAGVAPGRFIDMTAVFASETSTVFWDEGGHTTERASSAIGSRMASVLLPFLLDSSAASKAEGQRPRE